MKAGELNLLLEDEFGIKGIIENTDFVSIDTSNKEELVELVLTTMKYSLVTDNTKLTLLCYKLSEEESRELASKMSIPWNNEKRSFLNHILYQLDLNDKTVQKILQDFFNISVHSRSSQPRYYSKIVRPPQSRFYELLNYQFVIKEHILSILNDTNTFLPRMILHMPTGTGKTKTTMHTIINDYISNRKGKGVLIWLAHTTELLNQAKSSFESVWSHLGSYDVMVHYNDVSTINTDQDKSIYFISYQKLISLSKNDEQTFNKLRDNAEIIVADEAHKCLAKQTKRALNDLMREFGDNTDKALIGLTATPGRQLAHFDDEKENQEITEMFEKRIISINPSQVESLKFNNLESSYQAYQDVGQKDRTIIKYFQDNGILAKIIKVELDYSLTNEEERSITAIQRFKSTSGDLNHEVRKLFSKFTHRNQAILQKLYELDQQDSPTLLFACSVEHGRFIENLCELAGIRARGVYGDMRYEDRAQSVQDFSSGKVNILINYEVLTTGFDSPRIRTIFITRPTTSIVLYSQMLGRGLRGPMMGGNESCTLIDIQDNLDRFTDEEEAFNYFNEYWR